MIRFITTIQKEISRAIISIFTSLSGGRIPAVFYGQFTKRAVPIHLPICRRLRMNHSFLYCSQHSPRRRVAVVCAVRSYGVMLAKSDALSVIVTTAQREL